MTSKTCRTCVFSGELDFDGPCGTCKVTAPDGVPSHWRSQRGKPCSSCQDGQHTGLPGNACENCMNTGWEDGLLPPPTIVALSGPSGSGKSTAAQALTDLGYVRVPLAAPMKRMLREGLGLTEEHTDGALKEQPIDWLGGVSTRRLMQTLGTEWGRSHDDRMWLKAWERSLADIRAPGIVVDDVRFENEARFLKERGAKLISVVAPTPPPLVGETVGHSSEADLWRIAELADAVVVNAKTGIADFQRRVLRAARET